MNHKTDMQAALQACVDAMLHDGVPTDPEHPKRIALIAAEAALASRPDAQADERGAFEAWVKSEYGYSTERYELGGYKRPELNMWWTTWQARVAAPQAAAQGVAEDTRDAVSKALRRAWQLGQTYWQQADSNSYKQQDKSDETQKKFEKLVDETRSMLAAPSPDREQVGEPIPGSPAFALRGLYKLATEYFIDGKPATPDEYIAWQRGIVEALTSAKLPEPKYYGTQDEDGSQHEVKCAYVDGWNECRASILAKDASLSCECGELQGAAQPSERVEQDCPHSVDDGACKQCYGEATSGEQGEAKGVCQRCGGTGVVDDGEITGAGGVEFENGPVKCVKDCQDCADSAPAKAEAKCKACNGNDGDMPCAYPEGRTDCLRNASASTLGGEQRRVIEMLISLARTAYHALDNSEERAGGDRTEFVLTDPWYRELSDALDALDALPDDKPGYALGAAGKAEWALRELLAPQPQAAEPKGLTDEERSAIRSASLNSDMTTAQRDCLRALLAKGE